MGRKFDVAELMKRTKPEMVAAFQREIAELDDRRQRQIRNQVASINRLMTGESYEGEMAKLQEELADTQARLEAALLEIRQLRGEQTPSAYNLARRV